MNLKELIKDKTEELNQKGQQINALQQQLRNLNVEALKLDGEITGLKKAEQLEKEPKGKNTKENNGKK